MKNTNFKSGNMVNWLVFGQVALRGLIINRITLNQESAWVTLPNSDDEMIVLLENLEAA
mgnify:CR=1 FL=1